MEREIGERGYVRPKNREFSGGGDEFSSPLRLSAGGRNFPLLSPPLDRNRRGGGPLFLLSPPARETQRGGDEFSSPLRLSVGGGREKELSSREKSVNARDGKNFRRTHERREREESRGRDGHPRKREEREMRARKKLREREEKKKERGEEEKEKRGRMPLLSFSPLRDGKRDRGERLRETKK